MWTACCVQWAASLRKRTPTLTASESIRISGLSTITFMNTRETDITSSYQSTPATMCYIDLKFAVMQIGFSYMLQLNNHENQSYRARFFNYKTLLMIMKPTYAWIAWFFQKYLFRLPQQDKSALVVLVSSFSENFR